MDEKFKERLVKLADRWIADSKERCYDDWMDGRAYGERMCGEELKRILDAA